MISSLKKLIKQLPIVKGSINRRNEELVRKQFVHEIKSNPPVFVYQMGKVASSSVYKSVREQYPGVCLHAHNFHGNHELKKVRWLYEIHSEQEIPIKIISMVREPISRNISAFFQNFERDTGTKHEENRYSINELKEIFIRDYNHQIPLVWLDENLKENFGIDVFQDDFTDKQYSHFKNGRIELLLFKHNISDSLKESLIGEFIGCKGFKMLNTNIGDSKDYANTYNQFKQIRLPKEYLDEMLNSKYAKHFYKTELADIRKKWQQE